VVALLGQRYKVQPRVLRGGGDAQTGIALTRSKGLGHGGMRGLGALGKADDLVLVRLQQRRVSALSQRFFAGARA